MDLFTLFETVAHVFNVFLHGFSQGIVILIYVSLSDFVLISLFKNINAMESLDTLLQLLVVIEMVFQYLENIILELLLVFMLFLDFILSDSHLFLHTFALESHISYNKTQVFIHHSKVL